MKYLYILCLLCTFGLGDVLFGQAIHIVNSTNDIDDGLCNSTHCSLREALRISNTNAGPDSIEFNIPGPGPHVIMPQTALPGITDSLLVIDANTQPGNNPTAGLIRIDGSALGPGGNHGLVIYTRKTEIYGLQIQNFPDDGIQMFGGFVDDPFLSNITIGAPNKGNIIISNGSYGIEGPVDRNVRIQGNYIGTDLQFNTGLGNAWDGVQLTILSGQGVRVGGTRTLNQQNYLCSNRFSGLRIIISDPAQFLPGFTITGNVIGTDAAGTKDLGNLGFNFGPLQGGGGISLIGDGPVTIGGTLLDTRNIIAFNHDGIYIEQFDRKTILENSFYCNSNKGIRLENGANNGVAPPAILCLQGNTLIGAAAPNTLVYLYRHDSTGCEGVPCQGKEYLDRISADINGTWTYNISAWPGSRFTALGEDANGNSSEFSDCILDPNVIASNTGPYCPGDTIFLSSTLDTTAGIVQFEWFGPNGYSSLQQNPIDATEGGQYLVVVTISGCGADSAFTDVMVYPEARDTIRRLCIDDSVVINGTVYNVSNPFGEEVISNATSNGCDSTILINLSFSQPVRGRIYATRPRACSGDSVAFWFNLLDGDGPYDVIYTTGIGIPDTVYGIYDGFFDTLVVTSDIRFEILDIITADTLCAPIIMPSDSILVSTLAVNPVVTDYGGYGVSCYGENDGMISLNPSGAVGMILYDWNLASLNGDIAANLTAGNYAVTVTDEANCTVIFDTLVTQPVPLEAILFVDPTTCPGVSDGAIVIDGILGARGPASYAIDGGSFQQIDTVPVRIPGLSVGQVDFQLADSAGCLQQLDLFIPIGETPFIDLGPEQSIFSGDSVLLSFTTSLEPVMISWSPASLVSCPTCPSTFAFPPIDQYVSVTLTDTSGCVATDSVLILVFVPKQVFIPTVFSPNDDEINDHFYIQGNEFVQEIDYMIVADRWGNVVFEKQHFNANDPGEGWDGTLPKEGRKMFPAVFTYLVKVRFTDGEIIPYSGTVTLVR